MAEQKTAVVDGKQIAYTSETVFLIQIGRGPKASYRTLYRIVGNLGQAVLYYNGVNIGRGYKKRLYVPSFKHRILARAIS